MRSYEIQPWPKGQYKRYRALNACHRNAWSLALDHPHELALLKGYALMPISSVWAGHWWCVDRAGRVVDPTWKNGGNAYVGTEEVDVREYSRRVLARGAYELEVENIAPPHLVKMLERAWRNGPELSRADISADIAAESRG